VKRKIKSKKQNPREEIIKLILEDHKPLKKLLKVLKDSDKDIKIRREAFEQFAPRLAVHAHAEEEVLYNFIKKAEELREEGFEGSVEHTLAEQMLEEAKRAKDEDVWSAKVKVLAELVEHHIEEEENDLLPDVRKELDLETRKELGENYIKQKIVERVDEGVRSVA
jgi:hemerythrin-like domain-containing protein